MNRAPLAAFFALSLAACTSPYEHGLELGEQHAEMLRADDLTFERFARDLNQADVRHSDPQARADFRRGYFEKIEPVRTELTKLVVAKIASDTIDELGATAEQLVTSIRAALRTPEGEIDREKLRAFGRDFGALVRELKEGAEEFHKGVEEGLDDPSKH